MGKDKVSLTLASLARYDSVVDGSSSIEGGMMILCRSGHETEFCKRRARGEGEEREGTLECRIR